MLNCPGFKEVLNFDDGVTVDDMHAYMPKHAYIFAPTREMWPASSIDARIPPVPLVDAAGNAILDGKGVQKTMKASAWLDQNKPVEQMTWAPGHPMLVENRLVDEGGWIERDGVRCFNLYREPNIELGDSTKASPWVEHVHKVYPAEADHIIKWLAQRVQRPQDKVNHALVIGGAPGIGKDTIFEPVKFTVGSSNFREVSPKQMLGRFNNFLKATILRVSEARDLGEFDRYKFYDHLKTYLASPPDTLRIDEKNLAEHYIFNCVGVVLTTNYKTNGIYLAASDRRHFVAWSDRKQQDFEQGYWRRLYGWFADSGNQHVAAYLTQLDLSDFDAKAPPPKTAAFLEIVNANRAPEDTDLLDVLEALGGPDVVTVTEVTEQADKQNPEFGAWLRDRRNSRMVPHRFESCDYLTVANPNDTGGRWKINGTRFTFYGKAALTERERIAAVYKVTRHR
jgi:hypothetical protein